MQFKIGKPLIDDAKKLIISQNLRFEIDFDDLIGVFDDNVLVACGARAGYVLKMIAIDFAYQGSDVLGQLITHLILSAHKAGHNTVFLFTAPQNVVSFEELNFRLLVLCDSVALLEYGPGILEYLNNYKDIIVGSCNGSIVINGNPFTYGHQYLVEYAANHVEHLYVFIVREDRSFFSFHQRFLMAKGAVSHIKNVTVLDTSRYAVSASIFPSYFFKNLDCYSEGQMQVDLNLFAQHIIPAFRINSRFVGHEPLCEVTAVYNEIMKRVFESYNIKVVEIARKILGGFPISATRVRKALANRDIETLKLLVPKTTYDLMLM